MYKEIEIDSNSDILAITPLLPGHKISKETKIGLKRSDIPFNWICFESSANIPINVTAGIEEFKRRYKEPNYIIIIDRDIIPNRNMLMKLHRDLSRSEDNIAYCYCGFEFKGTINDKFYGLTFDPINLLNSNYISSNSMIKYNKLKEVGGFVTDNKYKRLLDWALWLKFLSAGYHGILCKDTRFIAVSEPSSISAGTREEYRRVYKQIKEDFVKPMLDGLIV
jgi:hypothetical protein